MSLEALVGVQRSNRQKLFYKGSQSMSSCDLYGKVNSSVKSKHSVINPLSSE